MSAHTPGCKYDLVASRWTVRGVGCAAPEEHASEANADGHRFRHGSDGLRCVWCACGTDGRLPGGGYTFSVCPKRPRGGEGEPTP